jgi:PAS domain S-box-containing protein
MESKEFVILASKSSWLSSLLAAVECLPISFAIATADPDRRGFPLIYVNKQFERDSGYTREEIIGKNCNFLQGPGTNKKAIGRISEALIEHKPIMINILNYRKDGSTFRNHLTLKPLFDQNGKFQYEIGLQFDMSKTTSPMDQVQLNDRLLSILPDHIIVHDVNSPRHQREFSQPELVS